MRFKSTGNVTFVLLLLLLFFINIKTFNMNITSYVRHHYIQILMSIGTDTLPVNRVNDACDGDGSRGYGVQLIYQICSI